MAAPIIEREPAAIGVASLVVLINLALGVGTAFGWLALTDDQAIQLGLLITAAATVVGAAIRAKVWSPASVAAIADP